MRRWVEIEISPSEPGMGRRRCRRWNDVEMRRGCADESNRHVGYLLDPRETLGTRPKRESKHHDEGRTVLRHVDDVAFRNPRRTLAYEPPRRCNSTPPMSERSQSLTLHAWEWQEATHRTFRSTTNRARHPRRTSDLDANDERNRTRRRAIHVRFVARAEQTHVRHR